MGHPLDGANLRAERADRHIGEAGDLISQFGHACEDLVEVESREETGEYYPVRFRSDLLPPLPPMLPLAISDAVHNLRAALDYVVYELARKDTPNKTPQGTQLVIADHKADTDGRRGFDSLSLTQLKGLSPDHVRAIEALQPYKGIEWTRTLRDISNPDKHRQLTVLDSLRVGQIVTVYPAGQTHRPGRQLPSGQSLTVDAQQVVLILISSGSVPVVPTLRRLELAVMTAIDAFRPEF